MVDKELADKLDEIIYSSTEENKWVTYERCKIVLKSYKFHPEWYIEYIKYIVATIGI